MQIVFVTVGAGYIGCHTTLTLLQANFDVVVLDKLCNGSAESLLRVAHLTESPSVMSGGARYGTAAKS